MEDLASCAATLEGAVESERVVWIEARLDGLKAREERWFDGSLEAWEPLGVIPAVCWEEMESILGAVRLEPPKFAPVEDEGVDTRLLRAIPYLYVQGAFATIRDVRVDDPSTARKKTLAAFPLVGFNPVDLDDDQPNVRYTLVRTMVGVIDQVVVTVRLPDIPCAESDEGKTPSDSDVGELFVPDRFFPLLRTPDALEVATAIGIHQATTARAVGQRIRDQLNANESHARALNARREGLPLASEDKPRTDRRIGPDDRRTSDVGPPRLKRDRRGGAGNRRKANADRRVGPMDRRRNHSGPEEGKPDRRTGLDDRREITSAQLREAVVSAGPDISQLGEVTHLLDQRVAKIMRRFGGSPADAQRLEGDSGRLIPEEVRLRYKFALDDVRQLRDDCRLTAQTVDEALTAFEHDQRERLQFVAALLASVVLVPTLIASVLGVNLGVPGEGSVVGFVFFFAAIVVLGVTGFRALRTAEKYQWTPPRSELTPYIVRAGAVLAVLVVVLAVVSLIPQIP